MRALAHAAAEDADAGNKQEPAAQARLPPAGHPGRDLAGPVGRARRVVGGDRSHLGGSRGGDHAVGHPEGMIFLGRAEQAEESWLGRGLAVWADRGRVGEVERAEGSPQGHQADQHAEVAHAIDDEGLVGRGRGAFPLEVEADQEP